MPSFLLNGAGGYVITETGGRIIISRASRYEVEVGIPRPRWSTHTPHLLTTSSTPRPLLKSGTPRPRWET